jgi:hypothetical protein
MLSRIVCLTCGVVVLYLGVLNSINAAPCQQGCDEVNAYQSSDGKCKVWKGEAVESCFGVDMYVVDATAALTCTGTIQKEIFSCEASHCSEACSRGDGDEREMERPDTLPNGPGDPCTGPFSAKRKDCDGGASY